MRKLIELWKADTPVIYRVCQIVLGIVTAIFALWATMPEEFKGVFSPGELKAISIIALVATCLLQLTKTK